MDKELANQSLYTNNERRKYHQEKNGQKNHWKGLIQHQSEINEEIKKTERLIRELHLKELTTEYDKKIMENLERKKRGLLEEQAEGIDIQRRVKEFEKEKQANFENTKKLQEYLAEIYNKKIEEKRKMQEIILAEKQNYENSLLNKIRLMNQKDAQLESEKSKKIKDDYAKNLLLIKQKKEQELKEKELEKQQYNELCDRYAQKEKLKDQNYKNFYNNVFNYQSHLQKMHEKTVTAQRLGQNEFLDEIISKSVDEKIKQIQNKESDYVNKTHENVLAVAMENKHKMSEKYKSKESLHQEKADLNYKRALDINDYNKYLLDQKKEKLENQQKLKQFLEFQVNSANEVKNNHLIMNPNEKKFNYCDLQAYKITDPSLYALIPGWSPQIGGIPAKIHYGDTTMKQTKIEPIKSVLNKDYNPPSPILFSPRIYKMQEKELEEKNNIIKNTNNEKIDQNYLSKTKLRHEIIYKPDNIQTLKSQSSLKSIHLENQRKSPVNIFSQVGQKLIK